MIAVIADVAMAAVANAVVHAAAAETVNVSADHRPSENAAVDADVVATDAVRGVNAVAAAVRDVFAVAVVAWHAAVAVVDSLEEVTNSAAVLHPFH